MSNLRKNNILEKKRLTSVAKGIGFLYPYYQAVEMVGMTNLYDFIYIDGEHGVFSRESIALMCIVADSYDLTVYARVPTLDHSTINMYLDCGVMAILGPHVDTASDAKKLVNACRYTPVGKRSWGSGRGNYYGDSNLLNSPGSNRTKWMNDINNEILVIAQLETKTSFNNLDEILNVDGIDAYAWGSNDLAQSMGFPGEPDHVEVKDAESRVANKIHSLGKSMLFDFSEMDDLGKIILKGLKDFAKKD
ncbi:MAG: hypothetical protein CL766_07010 [Chloroflexi bacterium]|nr:hypothetical protein [Chloroflexota bacterium]|tara:strand:+ start:5752 stop:6495 length:744 start_codon:yes stop_codon:yes gene_type:complete